MGTTLIPQEELRGPLPRFFCSRCDRYRYWDYASGLEASFWGRYIVCKCRTCGGLSVWAQ